MVNINEVEIELVDTFDIDEAEAGNRIDEPSTFDIDEIEIRKQNSS